MNRLHLDLTTASLDDQNDMVTRLIDRLGAINCDGTKEVGYFWSEALGWPLVWDQNEKTAIRAPHGTGPLVTWSGPPLMAKPGKNRLHLDIAPLLTLIKEPKSNVSLRSGQPRSTSAKATSTG